MKKLFAILLAIAMLFTMTAFAEEDAVIEVDEAAGTDLELSEVLDFDITMDEIPEGYTLTKVESDGALYAFFTGEGKTDIIVSIAHSEEFDGYTMVVADLTDEQKNDMVAGLSEDFANPIITYTQTSHGTDLIMVDENGVDTDYVTIVGIYEGYLFSAELFNLDGEVAQADIDTAIKIISDMWFVPADHNH